MTIYTGTLEVEPNGFSLEIEQMIIRHEEISFDCSGRFWGTCEPWSFSGIAFLQPEGYFKLDHMDDEQIQTSVYLFKPECSLEECTVEGFWYEKQKTYEPDIWKFSGILTTF